MFKLKPIRKKGAANIDGAVGVVILVVGVLFIGQMLGYKFNLGGTQATAPVNGDSGGGADLTPPACGGATTTLKTITSNILARGTAPAEYSRVLLKNGDLAADLGQVANSGTVSLKGGDNIVVYFAQNSTSGGTGYYASKLAETLPCADVTSSVTREGQLYQMDNGLTLTWKNQNGDVNTGLDNVANTDYLYDLTFRSSSLKAFGNPELKGKSDNAACFIYNNTVISTIKLALDGVNVGTAPITPNTVSSNLSTGFTVTCYKMPVIMNSEAWSPTLSIKTSATQPTAIDSINVTTEDTNYMLQQDTLAELIGVQDDKNNDAGLRGPFVRPIDLQ